MLQVVATEEEEEEEEIMLCSINRTPWSSEGSPEVKKFALDTWELDGHDCTYLKLKTLYANKNSPLYVESNESRWYAIWSNRSFEDKNLYPCRESISSRLAHSQPL
jgi:hypothetical protein